MQTGTLQTQTFPKDFFAFQADDSKLDQQVEPLSKEWRQAQKKKNPADTGGRIC